MLEKIKGEFLKLEDLQSLNRWRVHYISENGEPRFVDVSLTKMNEMAKDSEGWLERAIVQFVNTPDGELKEQMRKNIEQRAILAWWPKMHIAALRGESPHKFFESSRQDYGKPSDPDIWIAEIKKTYKFPDDFAPFRYFTGVSHDRQRERFSGWWVSWFPKDNELIQSNEMSEILNDPSIIDSRFPIDIHYKLNGLEEEQYKRRIKFVSLPALRTQLALWKALDAKVPLMSPNGNVYIGHAPIRLIPQEVKDKIADHVERQTIIYSKSDQRKRRTRAELEVLSPKIEEAYEELHDGAGLSVNATFKKMAEQSEERFGEKLSAGQLRGLYDRREPYLQ